MILAFGDIELEEDRTPQASWTGCQPEVFDVPAPSPAPPHGARRAGHALRRRDRLLAALEATEHTSGGRPYQYIDAYTDAWYSQGVAQAKRITANLPEDLLRDAMKVTRKGITDTLVEGLRLIRRARAYEKAMALRGALRLDVDLETSRERRHR
jgi:hypothetical protein